MPRNKSISNGSPKDIAIIGIAGRFPGAKNVTEFWHNLIGGKESLSTFFSDEKLVESAVDIGSIRNDSNFARVGGVLS
jgi:acyl transferase domain-containing protein